MFRQKINKKIETFRLPSPRSSSGLELLYFNCQISQSTKQLGFKTRATPVTAVLLVYTRVQSNPKQDFLLQVEECCSLQQQHQQKHDFNSVFQVIAVCDGICVPIFFARCNRRDAWLALPQSWIIDF